MTNTDGLMTTLANGEVVNVRVAVEVDGAKLEVLKQELVGALADVLRRMHRHADKVADVKSKLPDSFERRGRIGATLDLCEEADRLRRALNALSALQEAATKCEVRREMRR